MSISIGNNFRVFRENYFVLVFYIKYFYSGDPLSLSLSTHNEATQYTQCFIKTIFFQGSDNGQNLIYIPNCDNQKETFFR